MASQIIKPKITTDELEEMLQRHVCKDGANGHGFAFLKNVRNGTGFQRSERYADAIAMELTPSRGLRINGFELKVSRSDWVKEMKNPTKADWFYQHCDRWFLVVSDKDIVHEGELPDTWGLIAPRGRGLTVVKAAPVNEDVHAVDRLWLASLLRSAIYAAAKPKELADARKQGYEDGVIASSREARFDQEKAAADREAIRKFEQESGVSITHWYAGGKPEDVGAALKIALKGSKDLDRTLGRIARIHGDLEALLDDYGIDKDNPPDAF